MTLQPDGKILVVSNNQANLIRLNSDGSMDTTFSDTKGFDKQAYTTITQPDGKILLGGQFTSYNGIKTNLVARFNTNGTLDNSFHADESLGAFVVALGLQSDGKIIIGGQSLTEENGETAIKRLNTDGSIDKSFNPYIPTKNGHYVKNLLIQPNDKIILFTNINSDYVKYEKNDFKRLESNGSIDNTFDSGESFNGNINAMTIQKDGGLLVTGNFTKYKDIWCNGTIRLIGNASTLGTHDFSFIDNSNNFIFFPNPVKDILNISLKEDFPIKSIQIYNILGEKVLDLKNKKTFSTVDVSNLNRGLYLIQINSNAGKSTSKFLKD